MAPEAEVLVPSWVQVPVPMNLRTQEQERAGQAGRASASSCASIASLCFLFGMAMFPFFAFDVADPSHGIDLTNACSSERTLGIMQIVAVIGLPLVISYTVVVYWIFRGKVKLGENSY